MKRIPFSIHLLLASLLVSTMVNAKAYNKSISFTICTDSVPKSALGELSSVPSMTTTFNDGIKSITIEARYKNGTALHAKKINTDLIEVTINGNKADARELPGYAAEVIHLEDVHAMYILANSRIYKFDSEKNQYVQMFIDESFMGKKARPDRTGTNPNIVSPEITSRLIREEENDMHQNPYRAYIVNPQTNDVAVKEFSRNEFLQLGYTSRKRFD